MINYRLCLKIIRANKNMLSGQTGIPGMDGPKTLNID